jgi:hypothetical protein
MNEQTFDFRFSIRDLDRVHSVAGPCQSSVVDPSRRMWRSDETLLKKLLKSQI